MNQILGEYQNGNYKTSIYSDGTKIRENELDFFYPSFPECIDIKITDYCEIGCPYCHENSTVNGLHGNILREKFIDTIVPFTELAIGGGNPLSHPQLFEFLEKLKNKNIIASITVNQKHFQENQTIIENLINNKLIYGLGISFVKHNDLFVSMLKKYPNAVLHIINGIVDLYELEKLYKQNFKILILGYKSIRRGNFYYSRKVEENMGIMYQKLPEIIKKFKVTSFDNLAIKQLEVKRLMNDKEWENFYMGDDGQYTMYVDMVKEEFAKSSISENRFILQDNIITMFNNIRNEQ